MTTAKVTSKGQITIPIEVRQRLGIDAGDRIEFVEMAGGEFAIKPAVVDVRSLRGMLKKPAHPVSTERMREEIRRRGSGK
jgi:antitoxin PrlF